MPIMEEKYEVRRSGDELVDTIIMVDTDDVKKAEDVA